MIRKTILSLLMATFLFSCSTFGSSHRNEYYRDNRLFVYVRTETPVSTAISDDTIRKNLAVQAQNRALGLLIIVLESRVHNPDSIERVIATLDSYNNNYTLVVYSTVDNYHEAQFCFDVSGFEEELQKYE